ncbi:MAG: MerR family transcriptional regulator [Bilophila wadsworthia]
MTRSVWEPMTDDVSHRGSGWLLKLEGYVLPLETEFGSCALAYAERAEVVFRRGPVVCAFAPAARAGWATIEGEGRLERECAESGDGKVWTSAGRHAHGSELMALQALLMAALNRQGKLR